MPNTKDQVDAHIYESRRQITSLMLGSDEAINDPRRRIHRVTIGSVVIAVLVMAGFGVAGFLGGGRGADLPDSGAVIVVGTGDRYVVIDGYVHPALNLASALLVGGGDLKEVKAATLDQRPRGLPVGIPGAPDALPAQDRLSSAPWTVCVVLPENPSVPPKVTMLVALPAPIKDGLGTDSGVLLAEPDGSTWLATAGRRFRLAGNTRALLGLRSELAMPVPAELLNTIPEGRPITELSIPKGGVPTVALPPGVKVGDLVESRFGSDNVEYYAVLADGLAQISELVYRVMSGSSDTLVSLSHAEAVSATKSSTTIGATDWPIRPPHLSEPQRGQPLCISTTPGQPAGNAAWAVTMSLPASVPRPTGSSRVLSTSGDVPGVVSEVITTPGRGALVRGTTTSGTDGGYHLITDAGQRFPFSSDDALARLRYDRSMAKSVPMSFVTLLPSGPVLDPRAAAAEHPGTR